MMTGMHVYIFNPDYLIVLLEIIGFVELDFRDIEAHRLRLIV